MRFLLQNGYVSSDRMLRYNASLLFASSPPHLLYRLFQAFVRVFTWRSLRWISWLVHWMPSRHLANPKIDNHGGISSRNAIGRDVTRHYTACADYTVIPYPNAFENDGPGANEHATPYVYRGSGRRFTTLERNWLW